MIDPQLLADHFALSLRDIQRQTEGLVHADSILQLPFRGNCMNWTLGHILLCREEVLDLLQAPRMFADDAFARYDEGSAPITEDEPGVIYMEELVEMLREQAESFSVALLNTSSEAFSAQVPGSEDQRTLAARVMFYLFHEATHVGELGLLRRLAGKNDEVI